MTSVSHSGEALAAILFEARANKGRIGFVPTMGALHEGHLALVRAARARSDFVVVSIFVNPTQFGPNEDFTRYPRTLERDLSLCEGAGVDHVFAPAVDAMYAPGEQTRVQPGRLASGLCGAHRPGHFEGVATVVAKLFCLVGPCVAVFGRKDFQQLRVIEAMVADLKFPVEVVGHPIVREHDGLALSSRNRYLSAEERAAALEIPKSLSWAHAAFGAGERKASNLELGVRQTLGSVASSIDYVSVADPITLEPYAPHVFVPDRALLAVAIWIGKTRLIDNVVLGEDGSPRG